MEVDNESTTDTGSNRGGSFGKPDQMKPLHLVVVGMHMKHEGQSKYSRLHGHPGLIKQGTTMLALFTGSLSPERGPGNIWEGKPLCRVGLYTELIIPTLFLCFLLICYPCISLHF